MKGGAFELAGLVCGVGGGTGGVSELVSATKSSSCDEERLKATQRCAFCPSTSTSGGSLWLVVRPLAFYDCYPVQL